MKYTADEHVKIGHCLAPKSQAGAAIHYGTAIDTKGFREALWMLAIGTVASGGTYAGKIQEATDSAFTTPVDVTGAVWAIVEANAGKTFVGRMDLGPRLRYLRFAGTDAVAAVLTACNVALVNGNKLPVTQEQTVAFDV